jgi:hypothetical protein
MTHEELTAALRSDYRGDSPAERHNSYPLKRPVAIVTDPRNVSRPADWPRVWR